MEAETANLLEIEGLKTYFYLDEGVAKAVDGFNLDIQRQKVTGVVGESGCGKSVTAQSILRIVPKPGRIVDGNILLYKDNEVVNLTKLDPFGKEIRRIRGKDVAMIFQEPMTSLSPVHTIENQIMESIMLHGNMDRTQARRHASEMLTKVGISNADERLRQYPHQLSGGLRQRVMIAMALSCNPDLLIADEPTTALDVTVQAQILKLMKDLQSEFGMAIMYISHDLGVIAEISDIVVIMYLGKIVERGSASAVFKQPLHPYTRGLLDSLPKLTQARGTELASIPGTVPLPINLPPQCVFFSRCEVSSRGQCDCLEPTLFESDGGHFVRCFRNAQEGESMLL